MAMTEIIIKSAATWKVQWNILFLDMKSWEVLVGMCWMENHVKTSFLILIFIEFASMWVISQLVKLSMFSQEQKSLKKPKKAQSLKKPKARGPQKQKARVLGPKPNPKARELSPARKNTTQET